MLKGQNLQWYCGLDYSYHTRRPCQEGSDCCNYDMCRCGIIENAEVTSPACSWNYVLQEYPLCKDKKKVICTEPHTGWTVITQYCLERILSCLKMWDCNTYYIAVGGGYYGEEIDRITWVPSEQADKLIDELLSLESDDDRVRFVLKLEYGHTLPSLRDSKFTIETISKNDIVFVAENHYRKLDRSVVKQYESYSLPRGIVSARADKYKVVDGYHRIAAAPEGNVQVIVATS